LKASVIRTPLTSTACLLLFGSLLTSAALAGPPQAPKPKPPAAGNIASGKKVYEANSCKNCHSINGEGGSGGPDLSAIGADKTHTAAWFKKAIVTPKALHPDSTMPPYDKLKAKDLTDLEAYLGSLKKKAE
jgi:cbb3-type cytochrome oxidase cytochrome c subunit